MSLRLRIVIAVLALSVSAFAVFGDSVFVSLGFPSSSGRLVVAAILLVAGVIWFVASSKWFQRVSRDASGKRPK
jgi:uncharacterized membrane protein